jgi:DNA-directed RNA polymerase subunit RPC12/RpoP
MKRPTNQEYKSQDVMWCPVCGEGPWKARPVAECSHTVDGSLVYGRLGWQCQRCGAKWLHGQKWDGEGRSNTGDTKGVRAEVCQAESARKGREGAVRASQGVKP